MTLALSRATEDEVQDYQRIHAAAFGPMLYRIFYTNPPSQKTLDDIAFHIAEVMRNDPDLHYIKVTDTSTSENIAFGKWKFYRSARSAEELEIELSELPERIDEHNWPCIRDFLAMLNKEKKAVMGTRPYYELNALITHPDHQRRGAGGMLIEWGTRQADEAGLECYVEASVMGRPLYEKHRFRVVKELPFDCEKYGLQGIDQHVAMIRQPRGTNSS